MQTKKLVGFLKLRVNPILTKLVDELKLQTGKTKADIMEIALSEYLSNDDNFISFRKAGAEKWFKALKNTDEKISRFRYKNGNAIYFDWENNCIVQSSILVLVGEHTGKYEIRRYDTNGNTIGAVIYKSSSRFVPLALHKNT